MAIRYAVATGNWSNTATWDGGTLPDISDDVYADGKTITIDQDVTVVSIRTSLRSGGIAGGVFNISSTYTLAFDVYPGTTTCLVVTVAGDLTITGSVYNYTTVAGSNGINCSSNCNLTLNGNTIGGSSGAAITSSHGIYYTGNGDIVINGNTMGGTNTAATGSGNSGLYVVTCNNLTITGTSTGGSAQPFNNGVNIVAMTGALITGPIIGTGRYGIQIAGNPTSITINGDISTSGTYGFYTTGANGGITINGNVSASSTTSGLYVSNTSPFILITGNTIVQTAGIYAITIAITSSCDIEVRGTTCHGITSTARGSFTTTNVVPIGVALYSDTINIPNGAITGHPTLGSFPGITINGGVGDITFVGDVYARFSNNAIVLNTTRNLIITGNVSNITTTAGLSSIAITQNADLTINGNVTGHTTIGSSTITHTKAGNILINGDVTGGMYTSGTVYSNALNISGAINSITITGNSNIISLASAVLSTSLLTCNVEVRGSICNGINVAGVGGSFVVTNAPSISACVTSANTITLPAVCNVVSHPTIARSSFSYMLAGLTINGGVGDVVVNGDVIAQYQHHGIYLTVPRNITINGNITNSSTIIAIYALYTTAISNIVVTGNVNGNANAALTTCHAIYSTAAGTIQVDGNVTCGRNTNYGIYLTGGITSILVKGDVDIVTVTPAIYSGSVIPCIVEVRGSICNGINVLGVGGSFIVTTATSISAITTSANTITLPSGCNVVSHPTLALAGLTINGGVGDVVVNGDVITQYQNHGLYLTVPRNITVNGNIINNATTIAIYALYTTAISNIVVTGNVSGNSAVLTTCYGIYSTVAGTIQVNGNVTSGRSTSHGIYLTGGITSIIIDGNTDTLVNACYAVLSTSLVPLYFEVKGSTCNAISAGGVGGTLKITTATTVSGIVTSANTIMFPASCDVVAHPTIPFHGIDIVNGSGLITIPGNVQSNLSGNGVILRVARDLTITGSIINNSTSIAIYGVNITAISNVIVNGNITGNPSDVLTTCYGLYSTAGGTILVGGDVTTGRSTSSGISLTGPISSIIVNGNTDTLLSGLYAIYSTNVASQYIEVKGTKCYAIYSAGIGGTFKSVSGCTGVQTAASIIDITGGNIVAHPTFVFTGLVLLLGGTATMNFIGDVISQNGGHGLHFQSNRDINIIGNVSSLKSSSGVYCQSIFCNLSITGNITGSNNIDGNGVYHSGYGSLTVNGNITGGTTAVINQFSLGVNLLGSGAGIVANIYGTITGGVGYTQNYGLYVNNNVVCNITGEIKAGAAAQAVRNAGNGVVNILSDQVLNTNSAVASVVNASSGIVNCLGNISCVDLNSYVFVTNISTGVLNILGNVVGGRAQTAYGVVDNLSVGTLNISGSVTAGDFSGGKAVTNQGTGTVNITGYCFANNIANSYCVYSITNGIIDVTGEIKSSALSTAIYSTGATSVNKFRGIITFVNGIAPFFGAQLSQWLVDDTASQVIRMTSINGTLRPFPTMASSGGLPLSSDVRYGTLFGPIDEYTGTLRIPPSSQVVKGVPTDNTVGTWAFDDELITRLQNVSTVAITGQQIASYNGAPVTIIPNAEKRFDVVGTTSYYGTAPQGTIESSPNWNLTKMITTIDGTTTTTNATDSWDNHLITIYT